MMRDLLKTAIVWSLLLCLGCKQEEVATTGFEGTWVEETTLSDTLVVNSEVSLITLTRGTEMTAEGYLLPKYGSGAYIYRLNDNRITLNHALSSCMCPKDYFFNVEKNRLVTGNFYPHEGRPEPLLAFRKIR